MEEDDDESLQLIKNQVNNIVSDVRPLSYNAIIQQKIKIIEKVLQIPRDQIPDFESDLKLMDLPINEFENKLKQCYEELKIPAYRLLKNLKILTMPEQKLLDGLERVGFSDPRSVIQRQPRIVTEKPKKLRDIVVFLSSLLNVEKSRILEFLEEYPGGVFTPTKNAKMVVKLLQQQDFSDEEIFAVFKKFCTFFRVENLRLRHFIKLMLENQLNVKYILLKQPTLLKNKVSKIKNMLASLKYRGFATDFIQELIVEYPRFFTWEVQALDKKWDFLKSFQTSDEKIVQICENFPRLLLTSTDKIQNNMNEFKKIGFNDEEIMNMLVSYGAIFNATVGKIAQIDQFFEERGFSKEQTKNILTKSPKIAFISIQTQLKNWEFLLNQVKFTDEQELRDLLLSHPIILARDISGPSQSQKLHFIEQKIGLSKKDALLKYSKLFYFSLQDRIGPRSWIIQQKNVQNINIVDIDKYLQLSDESFVELMGDAVGSLEEYNSLVEEWKQNWLPAILQQFEQLS